MTNRFTLIVTLVLIAIAVFLVHRHVDSRREKGLCEKAIYDTPSIATQFGVIKSVTPDTDREEVEYAGSETRGFYSFDVTGQRKQGLLRVKWTTDGKGVTSVTSIEEITTNTGEDDNGTVLWSKGNG